MTDSVLVTGAAGFIGFSLARGLLGPGRRSSASTASTDVAVWHHLQADTHSAVCLLSVGNSTLAGGHLVAYVFGICRKGGPQ